MKSPDFLICLKFCVAGHLSKPISTVTACQPPSSTITSPTPWLLTHESSAITCPVCPLPFRAQWDSEAEFTDQQKTCLHSTWEMHRKAMFELQIPMSLETCRESRKYNECLCQMNWRWNGYYKNINHFNTLLMFYFTAGAGHFQRHKSGC